MSSKGETEADSGTVSPNLTAVKNEPVSVLFSYFNIVLQALQVIQLAYF